MANLGNFLKIIVFARKSLCKLLKKIQKALKFLVEKNQKKILKYIFLCEIFLHFQRHF